MQIRLAAVKWLRNKPVGLAFAPGPVLDNYRRVGWQISWVGIGGGGRLDIYTVDIAILIILTIVCYMYTGEKRKKKLSWAA